MKRKPTLQPGDRISWAYNPRGGWGDRDRIEILPGRVVAVTSSHVVADVLRRSVRGEWIERKTLRPTTVRRRRRIVAAIDSEG